jgi:hypothetical protein
MAGKSKSGKRPAKAEIAEGLEKATQSKRPALIMFRAALPPSAGTVS